LIQALGRGRGVNRGAEDGLEIDLMTDIVLPVAVEQVLQWRDIKPTRTDTMAASGVVLDNAADMARAFPDLWPSHEAAKKESQRRGTNGYYSTLYNSEMSPSSVFTRYRPRGAGYKDRTARFDLEMIANPRAWLEARLGPLDHCEVEGGHRPGAEPETPAEVLDALTRFVWLGIRFDCVMSDLIAKERARLDALSLRLSSIRTSARAGDACVGAT